MSAPLWSGKSSRKIVKRIVVEGDLVLQTPAHFGNGDGDELVDMPLLIDPRDGKTPLLTGASIAGALRDYLRARECGYGQPLPKRNDQQAAQNERNKWAVALLGGFRADDKGEQSLLIVEDARGKSFGIEMRDGVKLNTTSRTAEKDALYDVQLWRAGTTFQVRFELLVREDDDTDKLKRALATALTGLSDDGITLGARKRRGYGRIKAQNWRAKTYDLTTVPGLLDWIAVGAKRLTAQASGDNISAILNVQPFDDARALFDLHAEFKLDGSLLIRSGGGKDDASPDMAHLHSIQSDHQVLPILSGTSLAGALRARAEKIANTLAAQYDAPQRAHALVKSLFGPDMKSEAKQASRVIVRENVVEHAQDELVQNRVSIDRFTSGARETALFNEQPAFGGDKTRVTVDVRLIAPQECEIGLLLLLLKDLWTSDLPLGGESSVGRGRLEGQSARLMRQNGGASETWTIHAAGEDLGISDRGTLEGFVAKLHAYMKGETA